MKIFIFYNGPFGERFIGHLINYRTFCISCADLCTQCREKKELYHARDIIGAYQIPANLPSFLEDAEKYLPENIPHNDVVVAINIHPDILIELPSYIQKFGSKALIVPIEEPQWCTLGLQNQITKKCQELGLECAFPKPFCSLEKNSGKIIDEFIDYFKIGRPRIDLEVKDGVITLANALQSAPCGCTYYVAQKLRSTYVDKMDEASINELNEVISKAHHAYPCTASMMRDPVLKDTILHKSGYILREAVHESLRNALKLNSKTALDQKKAVLAIEEK